jgi:hypothetical protein
MILTSLLFLASLQPADPGAPRGVYVEARTAAVYAGACHFGGQYTLEGREAVLGWHFEAGAEGGVSLAGTDLVAVISGGENLDAGGARRSVLYLDAGASPVARAAARAWVERTHGKLLGEVAGVETAPVDVGRAGDAFHAAAGSAVELRGAALPERACCRMPYNVWYDPFVALAGRLVGNASTFRADAPALGRRWSLSGENDAFFGTFGG